MSADTKTAPATAAPAPYQKSKTTTTTTMADKKEEASLISEDEVRQIAQKLHGAVIGCARVDYTAVFDMGGDDSLMIACLQCYRAQHHTATFRLSVKSLKDPAVQMKAGSIYQEKLSGAKQALGDAAVVVAFVSTAIDAKTNEIVFHVEGCSLKIDKRMINGADKLTQDAFAAQQKKTAEGLVALRKQTEELHAFCRQLMAIKEPLPANFTLDYDNAKQSNILSEHYDEEKKAYEIFARVWEKEMPRLLQMIAQLKSRQAREPIVHDFFKDTVMPVAVSFAAKHKIALAFSEAEDGNRPRWAKFSMFAAKTPSESMGDFFTQLVPPAVHTSKKGKLIMIVVHLTEPLSASVYIA